MSVTFRFLHEDGNLPTFKKSFIHAALQTLLVLALLFSYAAHGIIITLKHLDLICLFWTGPCKYEHSPCPLPIPRVKALHLPGYITEKQC